MYISEPVLSYSYLSKGVDEAWVLHKYPYFYLSTDCEYYCATSVYRGLSYQIFWNR